MLLWPCNTAGFTKRTEFLRSVNKQSQFLNNQPKKHVNVYFKYFSQTVFCWLPIEVYVRSTWGAAPFCGTWRGPARNVEGKQGSLPSLVAFS